MLLRYSTLILLVMAVGCESTTLNHGTSNFDRDARPIPTLTSLSRASLSESNILTEKKIVSKSNQEPSNTQKLSFVDPFPTVYFPFDSWEINGEVRDRLDATADWMNRFPHYALTIEGHTDVRGTESYNMVLGAKRAHAVKEYLGNLGIPLKRIETVSYGKVLILCEIDHESHCHQYNRRAELLIE